MSWGDAWRAVSPRDSGPSLPTSPRGNGQPSILSPRDAGGGLTFVRGGNSGPMPFAQDFGGNDFNSEYTANWGANVAYQGMEDIAKDMMAAAEQMESDRGGATPAGGWAETPGGPATPGPAGWEVQNQWDAAYTSTASQTGVPGNFIKAIQGLETGGGDYTGQKNCEIRPEAGCLALNSGIFEETAAAYNLDFNRIVNDPEYAVYAVGVVLQNIAGADAGQYKGTPGRTVLEEGGWDAVAKVYFGGDVTGQFVDELGRSGNEYAAQINDKLTQLGGLNSDPVLTPTDPNAPTPGGTPQPDGSVIAHPAPTGGVTTMADIWGGSDEAIIAGLGDTSAAQTSGNPNYYDYSQEFGFNGNPGLTIGLEAGTAITAPISGTVVSVGSGYFPDGGGGVGEVRLQAPNGDIVVLGHMATTNYDVGDMVSVGDPLGVSGLAGSGPESGALQLEVRVAQPDGTYKIADPSSYFSQVGPQQAPPTQTEDGTVLTSPGKPASSYTSDPMGQQIADLADDYTNVAYSYGSIPTEGQDPYQTGWDCSGFVSYIADSLGISASDRPDGIPNGSHYQAQWAIDNGSYRQGNNVNALQPGDVVFFDTGANGGGGQNEVSPTASRATHVGIYLGDGKMINAMQTCGPGLTNGVDCGTGIVDMSSGYWRDSMIGSARMY